MGENAVLLQQIQIVNNMVTTDQQKDLIERLGALRRYL